MHIYFVLDRCGWMQSIAPDVIGGFNAFLAAQQADAFLTLVQLDSRTSRGTRRRPRHPECPTPDLGFFRAARWDPARRRDGSHHCRRHHPSREAAPRQRAGRGDRRSSPSPTGRKIFAREYSRAKIFELIKNREEQGWSFAYLGANQDAYAEGGRIGYSAASSQNFRADAAGTAAVFASSSAAILRRRSKIRSGETYDPADLFEGDKAAEADLERRSL